MKTNKSSKYKDSTSFPPAVVFPSDRPASLSIARLLGRRGIPVYAVDADPSAIGMVSRYVSARPIPEDCKTEGERLGFLKDLGKELGEAVLFPVSDDAVILSSNNRGELEKYYHYVMPDPATVTDLLTKDGLHKIAAQHHIPAPRVFSACSQSEIESVAETLPYPVILKPVFSPSWLRDEIISLLRDNYLSGPPKVAYCKDAQTLLEIYRQIAKYDPRTIIEEVIPGEDERLVYFCFYLDRDSKPLARFAGRKIRILPVGFGSATYVRSFYDADLENISLKLLSDVQYQGLGGIEFKKDPRDEQYKLIEFNARLGMWDSLSARCGIDIPYIAYRDALGLPVDAQTKYREGVLWIDFQRDVRAYILYHRRKQLGLTAWVKSYLGEKEWAIYAADDWKPALNSSLRLFERPIKALRGIR